MKVKAYYKGTEPVVPLKQISYIGESVLQGEGLEEHGTISVILVDNKTIQELNNRFLNRDRPTDVIAFPLGDGRGVWGEVYVSTELARQQAEEYDVPLEEEMYRLIIHGLLHLSGCDDSDSDSRAKMKEKEEYYLRSILHSARGRER